MNRYRVWLSNSTNVEVQADGYRVTELLLIFESTIQDRAFIDSGGQVVMPRRRLAAVDTFLLTNVLRYRQEPE